MNTSIRLVAALLWGSGFSALVYQTAWQRSFRLTFGASTSASAAVLAIFLGGLGLGGALLGRRVERTEKPLYFYGKLEAGIALLAALSPLLGGLVQKLYLQLGGSAQLGMFGATCVRLLFTAMVIGPAAFLMGGTLPAAARSVVAEADANRSHLALLYALNTLGAVAGALAGPLVLFELLGTRLTLWSGAGLNLVVALAALWLGRRAAPIPVAHASESPSSNAAAPRDADVAAADVRRAARSAWIVYFIAAAVGFAFLALELVWYRMLAPLLGGSVLTFGLILATALLGIGVGAYVYSRRNPDRPASLGLLATTLSTEAFFVAVPLAWGDDLAFVTAHLHHMGNLGFGHLVAGWAVIALAVVFPASVVSGYQFPALFSLLGRGRAGVGRHVGTAYAFNTVGTLVGSLLVGFYLLPSLGAVTAWRFITLLLALLGAGCAILAAARDRSPRVVGTPLVAAALAVALCGSRGPGAAFRHTPIGAGRVKLSELSPNGITQFRRSAETNVVWERDGVESSVAIGSDDGLALIVNGKSDGSVVSDKGTQTFLGLLPAALHASPRSAFVVGLGTGVTAGLLGRLEGIERVDVAELEPTTVEVAKRAAAANGSVLDDDRVHLLFGDGRELLLTSSRKYDLIVSEPSNPYRVGVASLFTKEFYQAARSRLGDRGLFAQWVQGYEIDARTLAMALRTMRAVFPYVSIWGPQNNDFFLIGSMEPQVIDVDRLRKRVAQPKYLEWMRRAWGMEGAEGLIAHHIASPGEANQIAQRIETPVNTDDRNMLEYAFGRRVGDATYSPIADIFAFQKANGHRPRVTGSIDWARVDDLRHRIGWTGYNGPPPSLRTQATIVGCTESVQRAAKLWPSGEAPADLIETWVLALADAIAGQTTALGRSDQLERAGFGAEALIVRSRLAEARGDAAESERLLILAFDGLRSEPLPLCGAIDRALKRAVALAATRPDKGAALLRAVGSGPFAVSAADIVRRSIQSELGAQSGDPKLCVEGLGGFREKPLWQLNGLHLRASCLRMVNAPDAGQAEDDFRAFVENEPSAFADPALGAR